MTSKPSGDGHQLSPLPRGEGKGEGQTSNSFPPPLLELRGITKTFLGVRALSDVNFTARAGEIHALMGENGAGKSTLIKVLTGVYGRDAGDILLNGTSVNPRSPDDAQHLGISTVYQEVNLIPYLSVAENICLGRHPKPWISCHTVRHRARAALS